MSKKQKPEALKIITVDDSPIVAERLQLMLNEIGQVEFIGNAGTISAARKLIDQQHPHVVILDIHLKQEMPEVNGIDLLIEIKQKYQDMKIMMLTNLALPQYRSACFELGADYFFDKSHEFEKIPDVIMEIIGSKNHTV